MNKSAIQKFAIQARQDLIEQVKQQAFNYGIDENGYGDKTSVFVNGVALTDEKVKQRTSLINEIESNGFEQTMEKVAYTWFNRFIALRFMEVNDYLPTHVRVFSDPTGAFKPEILKHALDIELIDDKGNNLVNKSKVIAYLDDAEGTDDLYRYLLLTQCKSLHHSLPKMFSDIGYNDYTELLLPLKILSEDSVIAHMVNDIVEDDFKETVEIIGWLYQYYNEERKNEVINIYKGTVAKNDIPAATQLFTTDWVVRYMVDNSLGKYWIERNPSSNLAEKLDYFVTPKNGETNYIDERVAPTDLTFFDPCMGSGHILVYAFDVLVEIYLECGYSEREAVKSIIENNIFGLDIDERAYQLAYFALMMKARSKDRRFLTREIEPQVYCPHENEELQNYGSIFSVGELGAEPTEPTELSLFNLNWKKELNNWNFKRLLTQKYAVVCTNPPYLNKYNPTLKKYVTDNYKDYSGDLFSVFIYKNFDYCKQDGYSAFMTPFVWMFIKTYEKLREYIISNKSVTSLIQMEYSAFEEAMVPICSFILKNGKENEKGLYFKLSDFKGGMEVQKQKVLESLEDKDCGYFYETSAENFSKIPGSPIAYWVSEKMLGAFENGTRLGEVAKPRQGMATTNNNRFLRLWYEVVDSNIGFNLNDIEDTVCEQKWFPYNKGGDFKKWYGNNDYIVNFKNKGKEVCDHIDASSAVNSKGRVINREHYFKECMSWSLISSGSIAFRYKPNGFIFDVAGMSCFGEHQTLIYLLALSNTKIVKSTMSVLAPTINFQAGDIANIPVIFDEEKKEEIDYVVKQNIALSKTDWDSFETSWDFRFHPLVKTIRNEQLEISNSSLLTTNSSLIKIAYENWENECTQRFTQLKKNEEELNAIFIQIYDLADELTPEVEDKDVTVRLADKTRDIKSFISYAVGCMFGRYSLDVDGLAYAGGEFDNSKYKTFVPDTDNVIPICDDEYFEDDIVGRFVEFVKVVYGESTLEQNLAFIAEALGGKGTPREVIRNYFVKDFYNDHVKTYSKRPIYWQFDSGKKNGFKALIYMHRYESDLLAKIRTDYVHEQQERYRTQMASLEENMISATPADRTKMSKVHKKLQEQALEIQKYEEKIHHLADQNISIDLDDGVVKNYAIFSDVVTKIK